MKKSLVVLMISALMPLMSFFAYGDDNPTTGRVEVYFSLRDGKSDAIVVQIGEASHEIMVQPYFYTSKPIAKALHDAINRGVQIEDISDKCIANAMHSAAPLFSSAGVPVKIDDKQTIARNKIMIIDRSTLIYTNSIEGNIAERLLIIKGKKLVVKKLADYLEKHKEKLSPYQR